MYFHPSFHPSSHTISCFNWIALHIPYEISVNIQYNRVSKVLLINTDFMVEILIAFDG